jgi:hypothetical protein
VKNDDLSRALEVLKISQVWEAAGLPGPVPSGDGVVKSPFREEKTGSFSISRGGKAWVDFGGAQEDRGSIWRFAQLAWPSLTKRDLAQRLIELSGITPTVQQQVQRPLDQPAAGALPAVDPRLLQAAKSIERRDRKQQAEAAIWRRRDEQLRPPELQPVPEWPDFVRERFEDGTAAMQADVSRVKKLAEDRGWPEEWLWELLERGMIGAALEPGWDDAGNGARRQISFRVDWPEIRGGEVSLIPTGFHQRFVVTQEGKPPEKKWRFVPAIPLPGWRSEFQRACVQYAEGLGCDITLRPSLLSPQPFVLGDLSSTKLIILLEGQWDAITFYGACGWFHDTAWPDGIAVFGLRGVQGVSAFLGAWHRWLQRVKPNVWAIADNDRAGAAWRDHPTADTGKICPPSFAERLRAAGCRDIKISWLKPEHGKDFNDYYRAKKPDQQQMLARIEATGLLRRGAGA